MENFDGIKNYEKLEALLLKCSFNELSEQEREKAKQWAGSKENFESLRKLLLDGKKVLQREEALVPSTEIFENLSSEFSLRNQSSKRINISLNTLAKYPIPLYQVGIAAMIFFVFFFFLNDDNSVQKDLAPEIVIKTDTVFQLTKQIDTVYLEREVVVEKPVYFTQNEEEEEMQSDGFAEKFEKDPFLDFQAKKDFNNETVGITMEEDSTFMEFQTKGI
ncbi:MAG: hypothetical protein KTR26_03310 [Flammeovirgaceae bacterium]|nr:hypothetical protein [Flammeovirgaceae bacterium]